MITYKRKSRLKMVAHRIIGFILLVLFILFSFIAIPLFFANFWSAVNWLTGGDFSDDYIENFASSCQNAIEKLFDKEEREFVPNNPNKI